MPFTTEKTITVVYPVPIPIGHRVKVQFFYQSEGILKKKQTLQVHTPLIIDDDTGIEYGCYWHYKKVMAMSASSYYPDEYPLNIRDDIKAGELISGTVKRCRVLTEAFSDIWKMQTTLIIESDQ
jgi:hypothetical protein